MKVARKEILSRLKEAAEMAASGISSTAQADRALDWGREQNARLRQRLPETEAIEAWVQTNAERFGWGERPESSSLEHLEQVLTETVSAILQKSDRRGRIAVNAIVGKLGGVAATGGIAGLVAKLQRQASSGMPTLRPLSRPRSPRATSSVFCPRQKVRQQGETA